MVCGASGSGKSTLSNLLAGFLTPTAGVLSLSGDSLIGLPPHKRSISYMGQYDGLFPAISIKDNLKLALHDVNLPEHLKNEKISNLLRDLELDSSLLSRLPSEISGGQLSRCNLARAVLRPCRWLILDEPFNAVDRTTRLQILAWLKSWMKESESSIILVSHDLDDIFTVATDISIIHNGRILEQAPLATALAEPRCVSTARILRSGLIISGNGPTKFVSSEFVFTAKSDLKSVPEEFQASHVFVSPKTTKVGAFLRIIDLQDGNDLTIPFDSEFSNVVWFDSRQAHNLQS